jgi:hypothetical protein
MNILISLKKQEVEGDDKLLQFIRSTFENQNPDTLLGEGSENQVYKIGETKSGLFVALRMPLEYQRGFHENNSTHVRNYELYRCAT